MQNVLETLEKHEANQLKEWYDLDINISDKFIFDVTRFAHSHKNEMLAYCQSVVPYKFSTLSIVYRALSEYGIQWNKFLYDEIVRVVELVKAETILPDALSILSDIDTENLYKELPLYIKIMDYLVFNIQLINPNSFNKELLDIIDWYFIELDEDNEIAEVTAWQEHLQMIVASTTDPEVNENARNALKRLNEHTEIDKPSIFARIKGFFS